jgi:hypothetical protein
MMRWCGGGGGTPAAHNVLPFGPVLANQLVIPSSYSYYALEAVPAESVLVLRVVTTTLACQDSNTLSLFLQKVFAKLFIIIYMIISNFLLCSRVRRWVVDTTEHAGDGG